MRAPVRRLIAIAIAAASAACTVHKIEDPGLSGPSGLARSLTVTAIPDSLSQDGASQASVQVQAIGPDGRALSGLPVRVDMSVGGQLADYGTLSARTIVTGSDGVARVTYTAPAAPPPPANQTTTTVSIRAIPIGNDSQSSGQFTADIRLMPVGVILPPGGTPTAAFTFTRSPVSVLIPIIFDASSSTPGTNSSAITSYAWTWGDGSANSSGRNATHTFQSGGTFTVGLTVTNDRGFTASASQSITVSSSDPFTGDWVSSPPISTGAVVGESVLFNADAVQSSAGHQVTVFNWNFGDGDTTQPTTGFLVNHRYARAGAYSVVLSVADDLGRKKVFGAKTLVIGSGNPVPSFTTSPGSPSVGQDVIFDASSTLVFGGATITSYSWTFGDGGTSTNGPVATHQFVAAATRTVTLTVVDSLGRRGSTSISLTIAP
jgi:PKD repeat protein